MNAYEVAPAAIKETNSRGKRCVLKIRTMPSAYSMSVAGLREAKA